MPVMEMIRSAARRPAGMFLLLLFIGFGLRIGYGVARYRSDLVHLSGERFINQWDYDVLEHVLIARALLRGHGYVVDDLENADSKHVRFSPGRDALFKAPLYQFFLAGIFALSGFSFALFFPLQALFGGLIAGLMSLTALATFRRPGAAWLAGLAAAVHPVLVSAAAQPANEDLAFLFFALTLWTFIKWLGSQRLSWAFVCGLAFALSLLTRESALPSFLAMAVFGYVAAPRKVAAVQGGIVMLAVAALVIAPWTIRNYLRFGTVVPVASIVGFAVLEGNNECAAREGLFTPVLTEPCPHYDPKWAELMPSLRAQGRDNIVWLDRTAMRLGLEFIAEQPAAYLKLCIRRAWTVLLPFNPRAGQRLVQRGAFLVYWLLVVPAGVIGAIRHLRPLKTRPALLLVLLLINLATLAAVLVHQDLRYRVGVDLLLGCFAGWTYSELLPSWRASRQVRPTPLPSI
jgi:hypothetical protein